MLPIKNEKCIKYKTSKIFHQDKPKQKNTDYGENTNLKLSENDLQNIQILELIHVFLPIYTLNFIQLFLKEYEVRGVSR